MAHFTVLGAGIVGTCCALALQRDGHGVTLIDRDEPGRGCSYGNAGLIQTGSCVPHATPAAMREIPRMMLDATSPLVVRWRYLPSLAPWLIRFALAARPHRVEATATALAALLGRAKEAYRTLLRAASAEALIRDRGELYVYRSAAGFRAAADEFRFRRRYGVEAVELVGDALGDMEPALNPAFRHAYYLPDSFYTVDPLRLTQRLAERFAGDGGEIVRTEIRGIEIGPAGPTALTTASGRIEIEGLVIAAGAYSRPFAARLGAPVPLESERGYHLMLPDPGIELAGPVIDATRHVAITPMTDGVRLAGTVELARLGAAPNFARADMLLPMAREMVPGLAPGATADSGERWMGDRPGLPDGLPIIGRAPGQTPGHAGVYFAFGHARLGLTLAAITGSLIADLASGRDPGIDLAPYRADRF